MNAEDEAARRRQLAGLHAAGYLTDDELRTQEIAFVSRAVEVSAPTVARTSSRTTGPRPTSVRPMSARLPWILVAGGVVVTLVSFLTGQQDRPLYWAGIAVTVMGLLPSVMTLRGGGLEAELQRATARWTVPTLFRTFANTGGGRRKAEAEAAILTKHSYEIQAQSGTGGHINVGRTVAPAVLTGGLSLLFGASRSKDRLTVTFAKVP